MPVAADADRLLRVAYDDELTRPRAVAAGRLRNRAHQGASVIDAHVAAAALAVIRHHV